MIGFKGSFMEIILSCGIAEKSSNFLAIISFGFQCGVSTSSGLNERGESLTCLIGNYLFSLEYIARCIR